MTGDGGHRPVLRIISGDASDEEIAAILAVLSARVTAVVAERIAAQTASVWGAADGAHRRSLSGHPVHRHGWRTSSWPR